MTNKSPLLTGMVIVLLLIVAPSLGTAQDQTSTCPIFIKTALEKVGQNCANLNRNQACYGYNRIDATFATDVGETVFSQPTDRVTLNQLLKIQTAPLQIGTQEWGIALLNVQANVPNSLPGQAVTFILLGDVTLENAVKPENVVEPVDPVAVKTKGSANLRSGPGTNTNTVRKTKASAELIADGINADSSWVHVFYEGQSAWIRKDLLIFTVDLSKLPLMTTESRTPMEAFYVRSGVGQITCKEAPPSVLVVQGPESVKVDITVNGADVQIGSTIVLRITPDGAMQLVTLSGTAKIANQTVPTGFTSSIPLSADGHSTNGNWSRPRPLTADELTLFKPLEGLPVSLLHYAIVLPTADQIQPVVNNASSNITRVPSAPGGGTPPPPGP